LHLSPPYLLGNVGFQFAVRRNFPFDLVLNGNLFVAFFQLGHELRANADCLGCRRPTLVTTFDVSYLHIGIINERGYICQHLFIAFRG
jgi:hypothetical protein